MEENVYEYSNGEHTISVVDLIGLGIYLRIKKENANEEDLKNILSLFSIPYNEKDMHVNFEKLVINSAPP